MKRFQWVTLCLAAALVGFGCLAVAAESAPASDQPAAKPDSSSGHKVTLYRDTWGTPHVYADKLEEAAFGMGYAQAEDRLDDIFKNVRTATGTMAEAFGPEHAERDYIMKLMKNGELCEQYWGKAPANVKAYGDNFMLGVEAYLKDHPERKPEFALELHGWQCMSISRAMILLWPIEAIMNELRNKGKAESKLSSNMFAIAPSRSADGSAILMTDPHMPWQGMSVFYEGRIHGGDRIECGFWVVGSPFPALGHNDKVAWAMTTGGPDTSDVFMVKVNPENPAQYKYNGEWRDFEVRNYTIAVKGAPAPVEKPALYSIHGPVIDIDKTTGIAYCGATSYMNETDLLDQISRMCTANSCEDFYRALGMLQLMEQNSLFADVQGNIQYVRNGRTPIRPEGYDWSAPVPGDTDASKWLGIHKIEDLIQIKNPPQGYMQNCNNNPEKMMAGSPMTRDKYKPYLFHQNDYVTPRSERMLQMIDSDKSITREKAMEYTLDTYDVLAKRWQSALKSAVDAAGSAKMADAEFAKAANDILAWNGCFDKDSVAAPVIRYWRKACAPNKDLWMAIGGEKPLSADQQTKLLDALSTALAEMKTKYGKLDLVWGDINLVGRSGKFFGCPGAEFASDYLLTECVMDVDSQWNEAEKGSGKYVAMAGTAATMVMFLKPDGIESFSVINWGQSADPNSPHHVDQTEKLYSQRKFKPTWTKKEDLLKNLESEKILVIP